VAVLVRGIRHANLTSCVAFPALQIGAGPEGKVYLTRRQRQRQGKNAPARRVVFNPDRTAMRLNGQTAERQAQARPPTMAFVAGIDLLKALEDAYFVIVRDARAVVQYLDEHPVVRRTAGANLDQPTYRREL